MRSFRGIKSINETSQDLEVSFQNIETTFVAQESLNESNLLQQLPKNSTLAVDMRLSEILSMRLGYFRQHRGPVV